MERAQLLEAVEALPDADVEASWFLDVEHDGMDIEASHDYCSRHAFRAALLLRRTGADVYVSQATFGDDRVRRCGIVTCGVDLDGGGLTDHGIDDALALTETDPYESNVSVAELVLSAQSMAADDPRWTTWERQAHRVLAAYHPHPELPDAD